MRLLNPFDIDNGAVNKLPMPSLNGRVIAEPSEIEIQGMIKQVKAGELDFIGHKHMDWLCYRLLPSLFRYGVYPPPYETPAANDEEKPL
jgi:predicted metal-dependent RNase